MYSLPRRPLVNRTCQRVCVELVRVISKIAKLSRTAPESAYADNRRIPSEFGLTKRRLLTVSSFVVNGRRFLFRSNPPFRRRPETSTNANFANGGHGRKRGSRAARRSRLHESCDVFLNRILRSTHVLDRPETRNKSSVLDALYNIRFRRDYTASVRETQLKSLDTPFSTNGIFFMHTIVSVRTRILCAIVSVRANGTVFVYLHACARK